MRAISHASVLFALTASALAVAAADLQTCRNIADAQQRLSCYDALSPPAAASTTATATALAPKPAAPAPVQALASNADAFGLPVNARTGEAQTVSSRLARELDSWAPNQIIQLANGQLWQVVDGSSGVLQAENQRVLVRRGALGTYFMEFDGLNRSPRVKRVQ
ncbi:hypothetical protein LNV23_22365 [Paucibacter sp. DJ1R-11]|uniref:hypothetical protein n=1 Tax=Paucibacter sp. DJ1R-11 TaxID=2893556 RepID=UPI0021E36DF0|nr:hypothetical protein [Paucibacter sp. DJ1R-11]MCV2366190.1 hypothetical protein [Paucibacter sp. DJ1R-11]